MLRLFLLFLLALAATASALNATNVKKDCQCGYRTTVLPLNGLVSYQTPRKLCPELDCRTYFAVPKKDINDTDGHLTRVLVSMKGTSTDGVTLKVGGVPIIRNYSFEEDFLLVRDDAIISIETGAAVPPAGQALFDFKLTVVRLPRGCDCAALRQTYQMSSRRFAEIIHVPAECEFVLCGWTIYTESSDNFFSLRKESRGYLKTDEFTVWTNQKSHKIENFQNTELQLQSSDNTFHATYIRRLKGPATLFVVSWIDVFEDSDCNPAVNSHWLICIGSAVIATVLIASCTLILCKQRLQKVGQEQNLP